MIGLRVGPFEIEQQATVPEAGQWYRARRAGMTRRQPAEVLVRLLPPDASADARAALQREFETLRSLDDPRVPSPVAFYEGTGALAVSAPDGAPLTHLVSQRGEGTVPLTPATLLDFGLEIAEALQHAHTKGKVHGHLSPDLVLLASEGRLVVWGFGPGPHAQPADGWAAPERARGQPVTPATDQWSLAALLASLVTGKSPWRGPDAAAEARKGDPAGVVGPIEAQWPALGRLLRRMLDPHPANRFPSLHPVRQELLALARKAGGTSDRRELAAALSAPPPEVLQTPSAAELALATRRADVEPTLSPAPPPERVAAPAPAAAAPAVVATLPAAHQPEPEFRVAPPPPKPPKRDPLVQEPLPVVRVQWTEEEEPPATTEEPASTEIVQRADLEPSGPTIAMDLKNLANLAERMGQNAPPPDDPPSGEELALDPSSEPDAQEITGSHENTLVANADEIKAALAALQAKKAAATPVAHVPPPPPGPGPEPKPDFEPSEITGSSEATTLFSAAALDLSGATFGEIAAEVAETPTAVPITDPGVKSDPGPPSSPGLRVQPEIVARDPYSETHPGLDVKHTVEEIARLAAAAPDAEAPTSGDEPAEPAIQRVAPFVAVAMILAMLVLLLWNLM